MDRRQFVFSALMSAAGSTWSHARFRPEPEKRPLPVENSPVPAREENVRVAVVDGATVLTRCPGESISLNTMGAAIWDTIDGRMNCHGVAEIHCRRLGLSNEIVAADVTEFVSALARNGYIRIVRRTPCYSLSKIGRGPV
jgi:hypothetical protein